jgi:hypothetical protein
MRSAARPDVGGWKSPPEKRKGFVDAGYAVRCEMIPDADRGRLRTENAVLDRWEPTANQLISVSS